MTKRRLVKVLLVAIVAPIALVGGAWLYRDLFSCSYRLRVFTDLSLKGNVEVTRCEMQINRLVIDASLDSAATAQASREIANNPRYKRLETIAADSNAMLAEPHLRGEHGWYRYTFGIASNGGGTEIFLDTDKRTLHMYYSMN